MTKRVDPSSLQTKNLSLCSINAHNSRHKFLEPLYWPIMARKSPLTPYSLSQTEPLLPSLIKTSCPHRRRPSHRLLRHLHHTPTTRAALPPPIPQPLPPPTLQGPRRRLSHPHAHKTAVGTSRNGHQDEHQQELQSLSRFEMGRC